ncbi:MAG: hypothetical protein ACFE8B_11600 [Candidatus Hermodarchaeota archaeon]
MIQFAFYLLEFFSGDWGNSYWRNMPVLELARCTVLRMFEIMIIPLIVGLILGKYLGRKTERVGRSNIKKTINILIGIGVIPIFFWFGCLIQYWFLDFEWYSGYEPPLVTGSLLIDSMIAGQWSYTTEVFLRYIIPILFLTASITAFIAKQRIRKSSGTIIDNSIISNTLRTGMNFSMIFMYYILIDRIFNLRGFSYHFLRALKGFDYFTLKGLMFMILVVFLIVILISNHKLVIIRYLQKERSVIEITQKIQDEGVGKNLKRDFKDGITLLKRYFFDRLKSPFTIIGLIIMAFFITISVFPQIITPYSAEDALDPDFSGSWNPPSSEHPLGQIYYGFDLLAHLIYGVRGALITGGIAILIGLIGGLSFGIIASQFKRSDKLLTLGFMVPFYIFPNIIIAIIMATIAYDNYSTLVFIIGILLIPMFTWKIAHTKPKFTDITRELIIYIPWAFIFAIFLYTVVGFLGFLYFKDYNLGFIIYKAYDYSLDLEHYKGVFWPGLTLISIMIGFLLVHQGLKEVNHHAQNLTRNTNNV